MTILQLTTDTTGRVGVLPRRVELITTDSLAAITAPGYLNNQVIAGSGIAPTDILDVTYNFNSSTNTGVYGEFLPSISNGVITLIAQVGDILTATITLNTAAVLAAYATPQLLVAAPGAGKAIIVDNVSLYTAVGTSAFAAGGVGIVQYAATAHGAGTDALSATIPAVDITAAASQIYTVGGVRTTALTGISNVGLYWSNQTQAFTTGVGSSLVLTINYYVLNASV